MSGNVPILLLAAGASSRMRGRDKLLEQVDGQPLIRRQAARALATGAPVFVSLPPDPGPRAEALRGLAVTLVPVPDASEGMAASIRAGVAELPACADAVVILPADMPEIGTADLRAVRAQFDGSVVQGATQDGLPGHPVLFPRRLFSRLRALTGDQGAKPALQGERVTLVALPGSAARLDLDTPEAWAAWRRQQGA